jgi:hypothetical protein
MNIEITTFDGTTANKRDCRFIKGEFYIKGKQCFLIDGIWYRINSGFIVYDYETKEWALSRSSSGLQKGIVGYHPETEEVIIGSFTPNSFKNVNVLLPTGAKMPCLDYKILPKEIFKENVHSQQFQHINCLGNMSDEVPGISFNNNGYGFTLPYCVKDYDLKTVAKIKDETEYNFRYNYPKTKIGLMCNEFERLGNYTFGFEFETYRGKVPAFRLGECGLLPLRDGSIQGIEYATVPLNGHRGIAILESACETLKKYSLFSDNESLHLHIGNINTDRKSIAYLYTICCILEDEIYSLFPKYYSCTSKFKARGKDYNMPLKKEFVSSEWEETFGNVSFYLAAGRKFTGLGMTHPLDPEGGHKWQIEQRYHWVNFIPVMFGNIKTIEFRCHVPTNNPVKAINWLYICSAIVNYSNYLAKTNADLSQQKSLILSKVLDFAYSKKLARYLRDYVDLRKSYRTEDDIKGDFSGETEINQEQKKKSSRIYSDYE